MFGLYACVTPRHHIDYDTSAAFQQSSFAWLNGEPDAPELDAPREQLLQSKLVKAIQEKGLVQLEGKADVLITYYMGKNAPVDTGPRNYGYWPVQWARGGYGGNAEDYIFKSGTLIVDIIDAVDMQLIWRGSARNAFRGSEEKMVEQLDETIHELFSSFPPPALSTVETTGN